MLYWYNYSSSPHVPLATDEEEDGCLSAPLPRSEDMASLPQGGMLPGRELLQDDPQP